MMYKTILADPPWPQRLSGKGEKRNDGRPRPRCKRNQLPYQTMTIDQIAALPIAGIAAEDCHLWLWGCIGITTYYHYHQRPGRINFTGIGSYHP